MNEKSIIENSGEFRVFQSQKNKTIIKNDFIQQIIVGEDEKYFFSAHHSKNTKEQEIKLWDYNSKIILNTKKPKKRISNLSFFNQSKQFLMGYQVSPEIDLYDLNSFKLIASYNIQNKANGTKNVIVSKISRNRIICSTNNNNISIIDIREKSNSNQTQDFTETIIKNEPKIKTKKKKIITRGVLGMLKRKRGNKNNKKIGFNKTWKQSKQPYSLKTIKTHTYCGKINSLALIEDNIVALASNGDISFFDIRKNRNDPFNRFKINDLIDSMRVEIKDKIHFQSSNIDILRSEKKRRKKEFLRLDDTNSVNFIFSQSINDRFLLFQSSNGMIGSIDLLKNRINKLVKVIEDEEIQTSKFLEPLIIQEKESQFLFYPSGNQFRIFDWSSKFVEMELVNFGKKNEINDSISMIKNTMYLSNFEFPSQLMCSQKTRRNSIIFGSDNGTITEWKFH